METTQRRIEKPPPIPQPRVKPPRVEQEEDFEATLGSLVSYYATLPPGALEAELGDTSGESTFEPADRCQAAASVRPRRVWAWVVGGASSMILGGVVTFALIVGRPDFWRVAEDGTQLAPPAPKIVFTQATGSANTAGNVAQPLGGPIAEPIEGEEPRTAVTEQDEPKAAASALSEAAPERRPVTRLKGKAATPRAAGNVVVRPARESTRAKRVMRAPASSSKAPDEWEDPYK